jgi:hypothetical protein
MYLNTLGVSLYRSGQYAESVSVLERSLAARNGKSGAIDLFFLAMAHHRLGHAAQARDCFDRAVRWLGGRNDLKEPYPKELAEFRAEAESLLSDLGSELPADVFARP